MEVPDTPVNPGAEDNSDSLSTLSTESRKPQRIADGKNASFGRSKRHRTSDSAENITAPATKLRQLQTSRPSSLRHAVEEGNDIVHMTEFDNRPTAQISTRADTSTTRNTSDTDSVKTPTLRYTRLRELLHLIINESLRVGGRPDSANARETDGGEMIEIQTRGAGGQLHTKTIDWFVDAQVPESILGEFRLLTSIKIC